MKKKFLFLILLLVFMFLNGCKETTSVNTTNIDKNNKTLSSLSSALNKTSKVDIKDAPKLSEISFDNYKIDRTDISYESIFDVNRYYMEYIVDDEKIKFSSSYEYYGYEYTYDYYFYTLNDKIYLVFSNDIDDNLYSINEDSTYFYYYGGFEYIDFSFIDEHFDISIKDDLYQYTLKDEYLNIDGSVTLRSYKSYNEEVKYDIKSYKVYVKDNKIDNILITATESITYVGITKKSNLTVSLEFSEFGEQSVTIPSNVIEASDDLIESWTIEPPVYSEYDIKDIYDDFIVYEDEEAEVYGYISGISSDSIYITDMEYSIACYFGNNKDYDLSIYNIGDFVKVVGTKDTYRGLVRLITDNENVTVDKDEEQVEIEAQDYTLVSDFNSTLNQGSIINIIDFKVTKVYSLRSEKSSTYILKLEDSNGNVVSLSFKGDIITTIGENFKDYEVGDEISIFNVAVSTYNGLELVALNNTSTTKNLLKTNIKSIRVENGVTLEDALSDLVVTYDKTTLNKEDYSISSPLYDKDNGGTFIVTITYLELEATIKITVDQPPRETKVDDTTTILEDIVNEKELTTGIKSTGDVNVLVIPIEFSDKPFDEDYKERLEICFNGTEEETGYESLKTYYKKSSYNKLNINATILDKYVLSDTFKSVKKETEESLIYSYIEEIIKALDESIDYSLYDSNSDTYIDCIYFCYSAPYMEDDDSIWWAYTSEYLEEGEELRLDNMGIDFYILFSYEFLNDPLIYDDSEFGFSNDTYINVNAVTVIHETGHALGLDDYYDYESGNGPEGGLGGADMMDSAVGDHNAYSKTSLGWIMPTVLVNYTGTYELNSYSVSGDALIIAKEYNNSIYTEFYIIDFYTPDGLYEAFKGDSGIFSTSGIRIIHVYSILEDDVNNIYDCFSITKYDNSYTKYKLLSLVEADGLDDIESYPYGDYSSDSDLFMEGDEFIITWYDGTSSNLVLEVTSIDSDKATITIKNN